MSSDQLKTIVYVFNGCVLIEQDNGPGEDVDLVRIDPNEVDSLIVALQKAQSKLAEAA